MQEFGRTIPQACHGSVIYDEVVLCDVHDVFPFLSNHALVIRYCAWVLVDCVAEQRLYTKAVKIKPMNLKMFYVGTLAMVQRGYTQKL